MTDKMNKLKSILWNFGNYPVTDDVASVETCSPLEETETMEGVGGLGLAKYFFLDLVFMDISLAVSLIGLKTGDAWIAAFSVDSTSNVLMRFKGDFRLSIAKAGSKRIVKIK